MNQTMTDLNVVCDQLENRIGCTLRDPSNDLASQHNHTPLYVCDCVVLLLIEAARRGLRAEQMEYLSDLPHMAEEYASQWRSEHKFVARQAFLEGVITGTLTRPKTGRK